LEGRKRIGIERSMPPLARSIIVLEVIWCKPRSLPGVSRRIASLAECQRPAYGLLTVRRVVLIAFALMVLLPSIAFGGRWEYLCRLDGRVRSSCCCAPAAQKHEPPGTTSIRDACCCTIVEPAPLRAQAVTENQTAGSRSHLPVLVADVPSTPAALMIVPVVAPLRRSLAPPPRPQSLFVRHCALLL
jgi:hypothetical protein